VFAGIWTKWHGKRGTKSNPIEGEHQLLDFLTIFFKRKTRRDRLRTKLRETKEELKRRRHRPFSLQLFQPLDLNLSYSDRQR